MKYFELTCSSKWSTVVKYWTVIYLLRGYIQQSKTDMPPSSKLLSLDCKRLITLGPVLHFLTELSIETTYSINTIRLRTPISVVAQWYPVLLMFWHIVSWSGDYCLIKSFVRPFHLLVVRSDVQILLLQKDKNGFKQRPDELPFFLVEQWVGTAYEMITSSKKETPCATRLLQKFSRLFSPLEQHDTISSSWLTLIVFVSDHRKSIAKYSNWALTTISHSIGSRWILPGLSQAPWRRSPPVHSLCLQLTTSSTFLAYWYTYLFHPGVALIVDISWRC